jgi:phosphatidylserine/phosphatidylglycerophosphate/cardiolipin synthase-like enzyme
METNFVEIVPSKAVHRFLLKFYLAQSPIEALILVSPIMGTLEGTGVTLEAVCRKARERNVPIYAITCTPEWEYHLKAVATLKSFEQVELRYNDSLHAKLYVCLSRDPSESFALLGSANLTPTSIKRNIEIAVMIYSRGNGRDIVSELSKWGLERLRTFRETKLAKAMQLKRR